MSNRSKLGKFLRIIGIVLMGLTTAFTLMGGAGTTCVALNPTGYGEKFSGIAPFQWLYILFVVVTIGIGVMGVRAFVLLVKGKKNGYGFSLITLILGTVVGGLHIFASRALRGSSMPVDMVVYITLLTLIIFLLFRIPAIWRHNIFEKTNKNDKDGKNAAAFALVAIGILSLTIQFMMAPTHTVAGINYADVWHIALSAIGVTLIIVSIFMILMTKRFGVVTRETSSKLID